MSKYRQSIRDNIEAFMIFTFNCEFVYPFNPIRQLSPLAESLGAMSKYLIQVISPILEVFGVLIGGIDDKNYIEAEVKKLTTIEVSQHE